MSVSVIGVRRADSLPVVACGIARYRRKSGALSGHQVAGALIGGRSLVARLAQDAPHPAVTLAGFRSVAPGTPGGRSSLPVATAQRCVAVAAGQQRRSPARPGLLPEDRAAACRPAFICLVSPTPPAPSHRAVAPITSFRPLMFGTTTTASLAGLRPGDIRPTIAAGPPRAGPLGGPVSLHSPPTRKAARSSGCEVRASLGYPVGLGPSANWPRHVQREATGWDRAEAGGSTLTCPGSGLESRPGPPRGTKAYRRASAASSAATLKPWASQAWLFLRGFGPAGVVPIRKAFPRAVAATSTRLPAGVVARLPPRDPYPRFLQASIYFDRAIRHGFRPWPATRDRSAHPHHRGVLLPSRMQDACCGCNKKRSAFGRYQSTDRNGGRVPRNMAASE